MPTRANGQTRISAVTAALLELKGTTPGAIETAGRDGNRKRSCELDGFRNLARLSHKVSLSGGVN